MEVSKLKPACLGRWISIFHSFGIEVRDDGRHSGCPICGPGRNNHRFRVSNINGDGSWICTQCGSGDGITLIQRTLGLTFPETIQRISEVVGGCKMDTSQNNQLDKTKTREMLNKIWKESAPLSGSDPVSKYLHSRTLVLQPDNVRYCPECYESDTKSHFPAMVAMVMNPNGKPVALHRTYLARDNPQKADIESPKKLTPRLEPLSGCAIRLFPPKDNKIIVCEGIETGIACRQIFNEGVYACISNTIMEGFIPPEGIRKIIICSDADANFVGQLSAYKLANRLYNEDFLVDVRMPEILGTDWNNTIL